MSSPSNPGKKGKPTPGVRGPGGPPPPPPAGGRPTKPPTAANRLVSGRAMPTKPASPARQRFEDISYPIVERLNRLPRFVVIVAPGLLLFLGLIQTGKWAWLGGVLLVIVAGLLAWLTALSWPVIAVRSRIVRVVVILVVLGFAFFKFAGRM
ncbi:MAG: DUF6703 family protein [Actinomycetes bacterium]